MKRVLICLAAVMFLLTGTLAVETMPRPRPVQGDSSGEPNWNSTEELPPLSPEAAKPVLIIKGLDTEPRPLVERTPGRIWLFVRNEGAVDFQNGFIEIVISSPDMENRTRVFENQLIERGKETRYDIGVPDPLLAKAGQYWIKVQINYEWPSAPKLPPGEDGFYHEQTITVVSATERPPDDSQIRPQGTEIVDKKNTVRKDLLLLIIIGGIVAAIMVIAILMYSKSQKPRKAEIKFSDDLQTLYKKKDEIEEMIKIAKVKFYKRQMDEDSYKEIVTKHQEKLIEIEARIEKIEKTVNELREGVKNSKGQ